MFSHICSYCLIQVNAVSPALCKVCTGPLVPVPIFLDGTDLDELQDAKEHWDSLALKYTGGAENKQLRSQRFLATINWVHAHRYGGG